MDKEDKERGKNKTTFNGCNTQTPLCIARRRKNQNITSNKSSTSKINFNIQLYEEEKPIISTENGWENPQHKTSNENYRHTKYYQKVLLTIIFEIRWQDFGHILLKRAAISANKSMKIYFTKSNKRLRGRQLTSLLAVIDKDLARIGDGRTRLRSGKDMFLLRSTDQDWISWWKLLQTSRSPLFLGRRTRKRTTW